MSLDAASFVYMLGGNQQGAYWNKRPSCQDLHVVAFLKKKIHQFSAITSRVNNSNSILSPARGPLTISPIRREVTHGKEL